MFKTKSQTPVVATRRRLGALVGSILAALAIAALCAGSAGAAGLAGRPASPAGVSASSRVVPASTAFLLPSSSKCVSKRELTIELRSVKHVKWISATVKVNGKQVATIKRSQVGRSVRLTSLPVGTFTVSIAAKGSGGHKATVSRTYKTCASKPVPTPTPIPHPEPTPPTPPPPPFKAQAGGYGQDGYSGYFFYVSPNQGEIQDLSTQTSLVCSTGPTVAGEITLPAIAISETGGFSASTTETNRIERGQYAGVPIKSGCLR